MTFHCNGVNVGAVSAGLSKMSNGCQSKIREGLTFSGILRSTPGRNFPTGEKF